MWSFINTSSATSAFLLAVFLASWWMYPNAYSPFSFVFGLHWTLKDISGSLTLLALKGDERQIWWLWNQQQCGTHYKAALWWWEVSWIVTVECRLQVVMWLIVNRNLCCSCSYSVYRKWAFNLLCSWGSVFHLCRAFSIWGEILTLEVSAKL